MSGQISRLDTWLALSMLGLAWISSASLLATEPVLGAADGSGGLLVVSPQRLAGEASSRGGELIPTSEDDSATDEAPLLEFVEKHQPALLKLLKYMQQKQPSQYEHAIKELSRVKQRLSNLEKRDAESYAIELELWQVRSQLRMLVAEILASKAESQEKLKAPLRALVKQEVNLDSARLQLERQRIEQRLAQVQSQLRDRASAPEATLAKAVKAWESRAFKSTRSKKQPSE